MAYSPDMMMSPETGPIDPQEPMDHLDHPAMDLPAPYHSPRMEHSVAMAGDEIPSSLPNPFMGGKPSKGSKGGSGSKGKPKPIKTILPSNEY